MSVCRPKTPTLRKTSSAASPRKPLFAMHTTAHAWSEVAAVRGQPWEWLFTALSIIRRICRVWWRPSGGYTSSRAVHVHVHRGLSFLISPTFEGQSMPSRHLTLVVAIQLRRYVIAEGSRTENVPHYYALQDGCGRVLYRWRCSNTTSARRANGSCWGLKEREVPCDGSTTVRW